MTHEQRAQMLELAEQMLELAERCDRRSAFDTAESPYRLLKEAATALRLAAQSASPAATPQEVQEACAQVADRTALRCVREQIPGDSVATFIAKAIRALIPPAASRASPKSAPASAGSLPSGESDPAVTLDCAGADTSPAAQPVAWREEDYRKARDRMLEILRENRAWSITKDQGEKEFDDAFQHAVGILFLATTVEQYVAKTIKDGFAHYRTLLKEGKMS